MADVTLAPGSIKSLKDCYAGINGVKPIKEIYIGVDNQPILVWPSGTDYGEGGEVSWTSGDTIFTDRVYSCYPSYADPNEDNYRIYSNRVTETTSSVTPYSDYDAYLHGGTKPSSDVKLGGSDNPYTIWVPTNLETIDLTLYDYIVLTGRASSSATGRVIEVIPMFSTCDSLEDADRYIKYDTNCVTGDPVSMGERSGGYYGITFWIVVNISQVSIKNICAKIGFSLRLSFTAATNRTTTSIIVNCPITMYTAEAFAESQYSGEYSGNGGKATVTFKG